MLKVFRYFKELVKFVSVFVAMKEVVSIAPTTEGIITKKIGVE